MTKIEIKNKVIEFLDEYFEDHDIKSVDREELITYICESLIPITYDSNGHEISYLWTVTNIVNEFIDDKVVNRQQVLKDSLHYLEVKLMIDEYYMEPEDVDKLKNTIKSLKEIIEEGE